MEVRCEHCSKLFRVSDEKIAKTGIKFTCTRCGEYVVVKQEESAESPLSEAGAVDSTSAQSKEDFAGMQREQEEQIALFTNPTPEINPVSGTDQSAPHQPQAIPTVVTDPVAVRCEACNKLFRVPGHKISGSGVKFVCTRCGAYVTIACREFNQYVVATNTQSISAPSGPVAEPPDNVTMQHPEEQVDKKPVPEPATPAEPQPQPYPVPIPTATSEASTEAVADLPPEPITNLVTALHNEPITEPLSAPAEIPGMELMVEHIPEFHTEIRTEPKVEDMPSAQPELGAVSLSVPLQVIPEARGVSEAEAITTDRVPAILPTARIPETPRHAEIPANEQPHTAVYHYETTTERIASRTSRRWLPLIAALVITCIAVFSVVSYLKSSSKSEKESQGLSSIEGLLITSVTGTMEPNGDILIKGEVQNNLEQERNAWFVVVEVYNTRGTMLNRIRLLNGKQLFTKRDYDVLAARGVNVKDLKERSLQEQGIIIAPKTSVTFEVRYIQPPAEIASFNAVLQPFNPVRLFREISEEAR